MSRPARLQRIFSTTAFALALAVGSTMAADASPGDLEIRAVDAASGRMIVGATIEVTDREGRSTTVVSDEQGVALFLVGS